MSTNHTYDARRATGYHFDQLASAFDRVRDDQDWQAPILAVIPASQRPLVERAVLWFTHTPPSFEAVDGSADRLVVRAAGFRHGTAEPTLQSAAG